MRKEIVISIRHTFAERIYKGTKKYELRKRIPNVEIGTLCWIYEPLPVGKVTGSFIYDGYIKEEKESFYEREKDVIGIGKEAYLQYYNRLIDAIAWKVKDARRCVEFTLDEVGIKKAPQSYMFHSVCEKLAREPK